MSLPDQTPKLPKLPFILGDLALLAAAWFIVHQSTGPLTTAALAAVAGCVAAGAILAAIPFLTDYARRQDEALDERQRSLEALARTITASAEQISIAANGFNEITELAHKNLRQAEQLPHKLQDKIAEFNAQIDNAREDDREELEKELAELRASESERLASTTDRIHKAVAELTKLDAAAQKQIAARMDLLEKASHTITQANADASVAINDAAAGATRDLLAAQAKALAEIESRLAAQTTAVLTALEAGVAKAAATLAALPPPVTAVSRPPAAPAEAAATSVTPPTSDTPTLDTSVAEIAPPPKRPRKVRREEPPAEPVVAPESSVPTEQTPVEPVPEPASVAITTAAPAPEPAAIAEETPAAVTPPEPEPAPIPADSLKEIAPVVPASADPFPPEVTTTDPAPSVTPPEAISAAPAISSAEPVLASVSEPAPSPAPEPAAERPARKRSPRKSAAVGIAPETAAPVSPDEFQLVSDDPPVTSSDAVESVMSSDGATRLIVTAYIGIGNRLFIRGQGPGLSWEQGVPLQFVSIGKWRWETSDATTAIPFKLYKNDEFECAALGELTLEPGHQQEVTARF